jgi:hypothetical protein
VVGEAIGIAAGNALNWRYTLRLPVGDKVVDVDLDDWMFLVDERVMLNKAVMSKWGFRVGRGHAVVHQGLKLHDGPEPAHRVLVRPRRLDRRRLHRHRPCHGISTARRRREGGGVGTQCGSARGLRARTPWRDEPAAGRHGSRGVARYRRAHRRPRCCRSCCASAAAT